MPALNDPPAEEDIAHFDFVRWGELTWGYDYDWWYGPTFGFAAPTRGPWAVKLRLHPPREVTVDPDEVEAVRFFVLSQMDDGMWRRSYA